MDGGRALAGGDGLGEDGGGTCGGGGGAWGCRAGNAGGSVGGGGAGGGSGEGGTSGGEVGTEHAGMKTPRPAQLRGQTSAMVLPSSKPAGSCSVTPK
eukprot:6268404-Prymnesium_polylepis.2